MPPCYVDEKVIIVICTVYCDCRADGLTTTGLTILQVTMFRTI